MPIWGSHISFYRNKLLLYIAVESNINYVCEIWTVDYRLKKTAVSPERDFRRGDAKKAKILKTRNEELQTSGSITNNLGNIGSSLLNGTAMYYVWEVTDGHR
jgi:hypothetical protein